ncbi:hypothetical protein RE428_42010 [Marinobacter nanhaiticus D15-8W]|uniref:Uncharacterized protein n=1 Tax=Marinobacter nanhaiticus D15-8W TaxID=626887 RepID=N6W6R2_9GAMM|nr:hypothetical protein [Marinobacter nanhaiticus]ENO15959.1 hypothetical protein J057_11421 [Marinobacter nanhaiticus D15-8W]BES73183.1 hypothetical protein RE428_42010 [Marinobacter nanhaiticus D15-8W]
MWERAGQTFERTLGDYFRERLDGCADALEPRPEEDTLWYVGATLARLGDSRQLFSYEEGQLRLRPLALLYKDAHEASADHERCLILRQLGDQALFIGALFPELYARKGFQQDYFVGMGGGAYDYLADNAASHRHVFAELAERFSSFLDLISQACARRGSNHVEDVLALYRQWCATGDEQLADQLVMMGISLDGNEQVH